MPILVNLRLDPFERTGLTGSVEYFQWFKFEFWRFVYVQQEVAKLAQTAIEFPPMQKGASFNLEAVKEQIKQSASVARWQVTTSQTETANRAVPVTPTVAARLVETASPGSEQPPLRCHTPLRRAPSSSASTPVSPQLWRRAGASTSARWPQRPRARGLHP